ncbi:MAG: rhodanese-like domain-containing protein [Nitrospirae bacterium]|nr:rhodanese-like domain-containing protein [Nitrospirota bacterium]
MRKRFTVLILTLIFALSSTAGLYAAEKVKTPDQLITEAKAKIKEVSVQDAKKMMDNNEKVIFLDIRDKEEYEKSHLPGAIHMSRGLLDFHVNEIIEDKNAKIVVI